MSRTTSAQKDTITEFVSITGASTKDAQALLKKHNWRLDAAMDAYYTNPPPVTQGGGSKAVDRATMERFLGQMFDKYSDPDSKEIELDGTAGFCEELKVDPEDVVLLAVAYELKSPAVGEWKKPGWVEGWSKFQCDSVPKMQATLNQLRTRLATETEYLQTVYNYTFDLAKQQGQRSIPTEMATAFWSILLPIGLPPKGTSLRHQDMKVDDSSGEVTYTPSSLPGWKLEHNQLWFDYMTEKGGKGVSKDTWTMFFDFVRVIDDKFAQHDLNAAWPSHIDDFVDWVQGKI